MKKIDELKKLLEENPVSSLPEVIDNFLQDVAQIAGSISYKDIIAFSKTSTVEDIAQLKRLRNQWVRAAREDANDKLEDIGNRTASIIKRAGK